MSAFRVVVKVYAPYPIESEHVVTTSAAATAARMAMADAYKQIAHKRRIESYTVHVTRLK